MLRLLVLAPLLLPLLPPTAAAWSLSLEAPDAAPVGLPFLVRVCVEGAPPGEAQARVALPKGGRAWQGGAPVPPGRYGPPFPVGPDGRGCADVAVRHPGPEGDARLEARARPPGGAWKARAAAEVALAPMASTPLAADEALVLLDASGLLLLRAPALDGIVHLPHAPGAAAYQAGDGAVRALPAPPRVRVEEVRAPPLAGVVLRNEGQGEALLSGYALDGARLPPARLAPGERALLGEDAPPDGLRHVPFAFRAPRGALVLREADVEAHRVELPRLAPGEAADAEGRVSRLGRTRVEAAPHTAEGALVAYATPDAGAAPVLDLLAAARREVLVEGYTLTSPDVAAALLDAHARGARVRVLLEGAPVGGVPPEQKELAGALAREGVEVGYLRAGEGFPARYASLHAKSIVVDRRAVLVATENLHASSYPAVAGAPGSRGFGLVLHDAGLARLFAEAFEADAAPWPDVAPAPPAGPDAPRPVPRAGAERGSFLRLEGRWNVTPLLSPDAGVAPLVSLLAGARASVDVALLFAEPSFGDAPSPLLGALVEAARGGARVRVLLDGHLDPDRNGRVVALLREAAAREGLPLEARLGAPDRTLHAKLALVDGRWASVGSMNWGHAAATRNREAGLVVEAPALAAWYGAWFEKEWEREEGPARREAPAGPGGCAPLAALAAAGLTSRGRPRRRPRRSRPRGA